MKKVFEDEFMDLQSEFISLCLELTGKTVDDIYVYISIEEKSKMFNAFFRVGNELKSLNQLNINNSLIMQFLKVGTEDIEKIKKLCNDYNMPIPSELKMYYNVNTCKYNVDYKYESICSVKTGISAGDVFMNWFMENK